MLKKQVSIDNMIIAHWGLAGSATSGQPGYRSQNPWQALEHYMESKRGNAAQFFAENSAQATSIDSGGSVWRVEVGAFPTPQGLLIDAFARELLDNLVAQNSLPQQGDHVCVSYATNGNIGRWEWTA